MIPRPPPPPIAPDLHASAPWSVAVALATYGFRMFPLWGIRQSYRPDASRWVCECCPGGDRDCRKSQPGKHPRQRGWQLTASADPAALSLMAAKYPRANYGVRTGAVSGLIVLDVDGDAGLASLQRLESKLGVLPQTVRSRSGREGPGFHLWFALDPSGPIPKNSASTLGAGLDVRGEGGFVVGVGSLHKSGRRYAWELAPDQAEFAHLPEAWLQAMTTGAQASSGAGGGRPNVRVFRRPVERREGQDAGGWLIGDGPGHAGFNGPIFKRLCAYFGAQPDAPAEPMIAALQIAVASAPKAPGRDVTRYMDPGYLAEQANRAREFILSRIT